MKSKWILTDFDNQQFGRQLSEHSFEFKELNRLPGNTNSATHRDFIQMEIDLANFSYRKIMSACSHYYKSMAELFNTYGQQSEWIIAECIFEQESGQY